VSQLGTAERRRRRRGAIAQLERALALTERAWGPTHVRVAQVLNRLGNAEDGRGRHAEARLYYARALAIAEAQLGPEHPSVAVTRANLCYLDSLTGRLDDAAACQVQVIAALEAALGAEHAQVAWARNDAGLIAMARGRLDEARALYEQALAIWRARSGPQHPDVAWPLVNLGELALLDDDAAGAAARCREALAIVDAASGADHPDSLPALACLARRLPSPRARRRRCSSGPPGWAPPTTPARSRPRSPRPGPGWRWATAIGAPPRGWPARRWRRTTASGPAPRPRGGRWWRGWAGAGSRRRSRRTQSGVACAALDAALPTATLAPPGALERALAQVFGFTTLRPGQAEVIADVLAGRPVVAVMPTGAGKSLCYQLPAVVLGAAGGVTLVVSPLIALMKDQVDALVARGVAAVALTSAASAEQQRDILDGCAPARGRSSRRA
jgi:tetratricopeptide (TPR) repeat protein